MATMFPGSHFGTGHNIWQYEWKHTSADFPEVVHTNLKRTDSQFIREIIIPLLEALLIWVDKCMGKPMLSVSADSDCVRRAERLGTHKSLLRLSPLLIQLVVQQLHVNFHTVCLLGSLSLWLIELFDLRLCDGQEMILRKTRKVNTMLLDRS